MRNSKASQHYMLAKIYLLPLARKSSMTGITAGLCIVVLYADKRLRLPSIRSCE